MKATAKRKVPYPRPGEILLEEFLKPMGITQIRLAKAGSDGDHGLGLWFARYCSAPRR